MNLSSPAGLGFCRAAILLSCLCSGGFIPPSSFCCRGATLLRPVWAGSMPSRRCRALLCCLCSGGFIPPSPFCCRGATLLRPIWAGVHALARCLAFVAAGLSRHLHFVVRARHCCAPSGQDPCPRAPGRSSSRLLAF